MKAFSGHARSPMCIQLTFLWWIQVRRTWTKWKFGGKNGDMDAQGKLGLKPSNIWGTVPYFARLTWDLTSKLQGNEP